MIKTEHKEWMKGHLEEIATAVMTAFFTALMFRVGLGMLFSIVMGLALAYVIRLFALKKALEAIVRRVPWLRQQDLPREP
ncbi:hypothetical protein HOP52_07325 [Halomonas campisalis]|uniref:Uncharacterized protein n=1 Tax=Billgrantia campisalis TaxID=74661 RepID=A0ABS9P704_9GAMM|nr:hypothetical protein [Halomonas campisalis]MCG6657572.1 hypothetical protein [Halomonas campisalis]MDR5862654.1 hypothetical protein [Halomonas campisalis]